MDSVHIREGRKEEIQYIKTEYDLLDELNRIGGCETLGYYSTIRRFINRKDNTKENQITYSQQYLASKMRLSNRKYYENLHLLYNVGLIDIDKIATVSFFINYNNGNANPLVSKSIVFFSTHDNINFSLKNIERYIKDNYPEYPSDLINIVKVEVNTHYVIHYIPPMDVYEKNNYKLVEYRRWDIDMAKFRRGKGKEETNTTVN
ncbi:MAG TPA: hypothetical protein VEF53_14930, partial [Patescibacteria group bacterium]|nr:hypothetical protein [Patescibacteria group bacterium]